MEVSPSPAQRPDRRDRSSKEHVRSQLDDLADLALDVLPAMVDEDTGLFSHKTTVVDGEYVNARPNVLYSTVTLVGLLEQRRKPADAVMPIGPALDSAHSAVGAPTVGNAACANLLWASVLAEDPRGEVLLARLLEVTPNERATAELGQILYGLVIGARAYPAQRDAAMRVAHACAVELLARFSPEGRVFSAFPRRRMPRRSLLEGRLTSFASQVYPLHGLAALYLMTEAPPPRELALVANRIVDCQGALGQWWWMYSNRAPRIVEGYPVYSVHQDGMAFLGLVELDRLGVGNYWDALALGLDWLAGANELEVDMVDRSPGLINRCIQRTGSDADGRYGLSGAGYTRALGRSLAPGMFDGAASAGAGGFEVLRECRSYHLGWLLYAQGLVERA
jgi:hypothetical protein